MTNLKWSLFSAFSLFFTLVAPLESYCLFVKHDGVKPVTRFDLLTERNSGTHYTQQLILQNTDLVSHQFGHSHFRPWFSLGEESYKGPKEQYTLEGSDEHLFILVVRDPYDWSQSHHAKPHYSVPELKNIPYSTFIRSPWKTSPDEKDIKKLVKWNPLLDKNPKNGKLFANIFKLRTAKLTNFLLIREKVDNFIALRYEDLRDHPKKVLEEISAIFHIPLKPFQPITDYKGIHKLGKFRKKKYPPISQEDIRYINSQLDEELENLFGYQLRDCHSLQK